MKVVIFGHSKVKFENRRPLVTKRMGSLGVNGLLDQFHFRFKRASTHSAIHHGLFKAASFQGLDVIWTDDVQELGIGNIVLTEAKYLDALGDLSRFGKIILHGESVAFPDLISGHNNLFIWENFKGNIQKHEHECIGELCYFDQRKRVIHMPWATDIFVSEAEISKPEFGSSFYVGNFSSDALQMARQLVSNDFDFYRVSGVDFTIARQFVERSEFTFDVRNQHHINCGYVPCRIFKNFSYGRICFTNSRYISKYFGIPLFNDRSSLRENIENHRCGLFSDLIPHLKSEMLKHHTYINRLNTLRKLVGF